MRALCPANLLHLRNIAQFVLYKVLLSIFSLLLRLCHLGAASSLVCLPAIDLFGLTCQRRKRREYREYSLMQSTAQQLAWQAQYHSLSLPSEAHDLAQAEEGGP